MIDKLELNEWIQEIDKLDSIISSWDGNEVDISNISAELKKIENEIKPFENDEFFENVISLLKKLTPYYINSDEDDNNKIRDLFEKKFGLLNYLSGLPSKLSTDISTPNDIDIFITGLVAASIQDGRIDTRDYILSLNELVNTAKNVGIVINKPIKILISSSSDNERSQMFGSTKSIFRNFISNQ